MGVVNISGISDSRVAPICKKIIDENEGQCLVIAPTYAGVKRLASDISFFVNKKIYIVPPDGEILRSYEAKNPDSNFELLAALRAMCEGEDCIIVAPVDTAIKRLVPKEEFVRNALHLGKDEEIDTRSVMQNLIDMGYERVPLVYAKGQFAMRGDILDIFTPYEDNPVRIQLFDTIIEDLKSFDPVTQRSIEKISEISVYPAVLLTKNEEAYARAVKKISANYKDMPDRRDELIALIENGSGISRLENYIGYFYPECETLADYLCADTVIIDDPNRSYEVISERYKEFRNDFDVLAEKEILSPKDKKLVPDKADYIKLYDKGKVYLCTQLTRAVKGVDVYESVHNVTSLQTLQYNGKMDILEKDIRRFLMKKYKVTLVSGTEERYETLKEFLSHADLDGLVEIKIGNLTSGMDFPEEKFTYITDRDIFGFAKKKSSRRRVTRDDKNRQKIKSFNEIEPGDYVVHETQGIGKFVGLEQLSVNDEKKDYFKIKYAGNDMLYLPVDQMDLIQKYIGGDVENVKINKLNAKNWRRTKAKAKASVAKMAKELIEVTAKREKNKGYKFGEDTVWQKEFEESFPYEETADQLRCVEEIKRDMESDKPMDRLLCGDVGYGKTEVAARAIFKCVAEGKQVCMLVPTTILASQHYYTLKERFEQFPFTVDMISRFRSRENQKKTLENMAKGLTDVVIGTHRLLSDDVKFRDLGLLVIDEEQRFGVQHKEKIKKLKSSVDVLTLSATPIPRTLHMSLLGIRDMSLIEEPPEDRYPVQTYVMEEDDYIVKEAIEKELKRGGQVYVITNKVLGINRIADRLSKLVPEARIGVGHGQMNETLLEDVMMSFMDGDIDVLVATTIVESGIDIPNVNTLIVLDADNFGLSQLYQLRGRVGRSSRIAYAYLLHQKNKVLTDVAAKRLKAIKSFTEFGAGFKISMRDLEIRGAGNILGTEQSGHIANIGYELYCKLVQDAVRALKGEVVSSEREETLIDIKISAFIPEDYIEDEVTKLSMYRRIATITDREDIADLEEEFTDRFGEIPKATKNLIQISYIKSLATDLEIRKVKTSGEKLILSYGEKSGIQPVVMYLDKNKKMLSEVTEILEMMSKKAEMEKNENAV